MMAGMVIRSYYFMKSGKVNLIIFQHNAIHSMKEFFPSKRI